MAVPASATCWWAVSPSQWCATPPAPCWLSANPAIANQRTKASTLLALSLSETRSTVGVDDAATLDGVYDGSGQLLGQRRAAPTATQFVIFAQMLRAGIASPVHHNCPLAGIAVLARAQAIETQ